MMGYVTDGRFCCEHRALFACSPGRVLTVSNTVSGTASGDASRMNNRPRYVTQPALSRKQKYMHTQSYMVCKLNQFN